MLTFLRAPFAPVRMDRQHQPKITETQPPIREHRHPEKYSRCKKTAMLSFSYNVMTLNYTFMDNKEDTFIPGLTLFFFLWLKTLEESVLKRTGG